MKKQIVLFFVTVMVAAMGHAQDYSSRASVSSGQEISSRGARIAIFKPFLDAKIKFEGGSGDDKIDDSLGLSLGYAMLPVQAVGMTFNLAYIQLKDQNTTSGMVRLDGNVAFAFNSVVNFKGGLNVSKVTNGVVWQDLNPSLGGQASLGFQATPNLGLDIGYVLMSQSGKLYGQNFTLEESGLEVALSGTFF